MTSASVRPGDAAPDLLQGSIDQYVATAVPRCAPDDSIGDVRASLVGHRYESCDEVIVCEADAGGVRPVGLIPLERLLATDAAATAASVMDTDPPVVAPGMNEEQAAWKAVTHGESSLVVVDAEGHLVGLVPPTRLIGALLRDHDDDFARLGGYLASTASARRSAEEPLGRRLWHRTPWLVVGLLGAAGAAWLMDGFEPTLQSDLRLAFFVPGVVYLADAVGTQTEALVIRGLSVGVPVRRAFRLEALTGLVMGVMLAAVTFPAVLLVFGSVGLAAAVSLALMVACAVATLVAMLLPWALARSGRDPAFGSGPLATVLQDLLSLLALLALAVPLVG